MEFWGVEVKPGETVKCEPGEERLLHLSQAALGESKDKAANIPLHVKFNDQKLVLGTLHAEKCAQISYDLVFEKEFELSHGSKNASVYFCGYKSDHPEDDSPSDDELPEFDSEEDLPVAPVANGKGKAKAQGEKPTAKSNAEKDDKPKAKKGGPVKAEQEADDEDEDDEDEDDSDDDSEGSDGDEDMMEATGDSGEDEDSESDEEDEATPKKSAANNKKRQVESASKTPVPEKKAKLVTPAGKQKTGDGKKSGHVATPYPSKQAGKTPANSDKAKQQQSPKSAGSVTCKSCSKGFKNENALEAHTKAKHGGGGK